jgi:hypothetical protein
MKSPFGSCVLIYLVLSLGCSSASTQMGNESQIADQSSSRSESPDIKRSTDPTEVTGKMPQHIEKPWREFIASGQYRLAQMSDMNFSPTAKSQLPGKGETPLPLYDYAWGDLNYSKRIEDDHLAAIVVDTTKNDVNRFGLVIFSPVKGKHEEYNINWLYRNVDLSKFTVNRASGDLYVTQYSDDGRQSSCSVKWNKKLKTFECH